MPIKVAINGFGRIGRASYKILLERDDAEVVAINDLTDPQTLAHLLRFDTVYGRYDKKVDLEDGSFVVNGKKSKLFCEKDPLKLPWKDLEVDVVLECTGVFVKDGAAKVHIEAGAKKVVLSAPAKGGNIQTFLIGVNDAQYLGQNIISNASCTTNCIAPVIAVIHNALGIKKATMTTVHAVTADQNLVDGPHKDLRRARAADYNIIPTTTGAAIATTEVIPDLKDKFDGLAIRVPVFVGSLSDITMLVNKPATVEEVNSLFIKAKNDPLYKNVLDATYDPLVSSDIIKSNYSAIVDLSVTSVIDGDLVKVFAWYDNEWGYSNRLVELAVMISK
ncbi:type I glyceraldehyde-3-phosphate dehydrogenase [candidate division WWE3 bacterium RBG_19FT_COMBO_34_6]|uniref:Glyceraldehyde-3-phosphate dehydrogenase n=1 Tax=candidate division WWE3 bacterium RBG_19FT_COMBO_34_6 TaxID=1802612 RepID=A0A1F4ULQ5_UNCKA|nr:MAG: type I glyceraldehyde-3-phosphate dehydrogenase [candidate division WWE3 bacterium RBG_19FT_COMBO_34_6]